jgi:dienelactone hydrolase
MRRFAVVAALAVVTLRHPAASATSCPSLPTGSTMQVVEYFSGPPAKPGDHTCTKDGKRCSLKGWLYIPQAPKANLPAVVFLHGHARKRSEPCTIAFAFLAAGWVVFAPLRSGNTAEEFSNTGTYIDDWADAQGGDKVERQVEYLRSYQVHDVDHAIRFLREFRFKGNRRVQHIALLGHSFGGSLAVFAASEDFPHRPDAVADVQGAELSWGEDGGAWKEPLLIAVKKRKEPIFFLQPRNGKSISPTIVLSQMAAMSGDNQFHAALFPPVLSSDVHGDFITSPTSVYGWAPVVIAFFERYMSH